MSVYVVNMVTLSFLEQEAPLRPFWKYGGDLARACPVYDTPRNRDSADCAALNRSTTPLYSFAVLSTDFKIEDSRLYTPSKGLLNRTILF